MFIIIIFFFCQELGSHLVRLSQICSLIYLIYVCFLVSSPFICICPCPSLTSPKDFIVVGFEVLALLIMKSSAF